MNVNAGLARGGGALGHLQQNNDAVKGMKVVICVCIAMNGPIDPPATLVGLD